MSLFPADLRVSHLDGGESGFFELSEALETACAEARTAGESRSLVELRPRPRDWQIVREWLQTLAEPLARAALRGGETSTGFGVLMLFTLSEQGRRHGDDGEVYVCADSLPLQDGVRGFLFAGGAPRQSLREALEAAARCHGLRHVFDDPDRARWLATVSLQHGFTRRGAARSLPVWLAGDRPRAVDDLLGEGPAGHRLASGSFRELWNLLEAADREDPAALEPRVAASAWCPPGAAAELVAAARRPRPAVVGGGNADTPAASITTPIGSRVRGNGDDPPAAPAPPGSAARVRLVWPPGGAPAFRFEIDPPDGAAEIGDADGAGGDADGPRVRRLVVSGRAVRTFVRQPDSTWASTAGDGTVPVNRCGPTVAVSWTTANGAAGADVNEEIGDRELYDAARDVNVWTNRGTPRDALSDSFGDGSELFVMASDDLGVPDGYETAAGPPGFRLVRLPVGAVRAFRLTLGTATLWSPGMRPGSGVAGESVFVEALDQPMRRPRARGEATLRVVATGGYRPVRLRVNRREAPLERVGRGVWRAGPVDVLALPRPWAARCELLAEGPDGVARLARTVALHPCGLYLLAPGSGGGGPADGRCWTRVDPPEEGGPPDVRCDLLSKHPVRTVPPSTDEGTGDDRVWAVMAGDAFVGRPCGPTGRPGPLHDLPGRGERLTARIGPYNQPPGEEDHVLSPPVVDRGIVLTAEVKAGGLFAEGEEANGEEAEGGEQVTLSLAQPIRPRPGHAVHLLYPRGVAAADHELIRPGDDGRTWTVRTDRLAGATFEGRPPVAAAVSFRGRWLGGWWTDDWAGWLFGENSPADPAVAAAAVRWFRLPVLSDAGAARPNGGTGAAPRDAVRKFAARNGFACVRAWLLDETHEALADRKLIESRGEAAEDLTPTSGDFPAGWHMAVRSLLKRWDPTEAEAVGLVHRLANAAGPGAGPSAILRAVLDPFRYAPLTLGRVLAAAAGDPHVRPLLKCFTPPREEPLRPMLEASCRWAAEVGVPRGPAPAWQETNLDVALNRADVRDRVTALIVRAVAAGRLRPPVGGTVSPVPASTRR